MFLGMTAQEFPPSINKNPVNWAEWENQMPAQEKLKLIESLNMVMGIEIALNAYNYTLSNIINNFHIIDFNNDGQRDVIYTGFIGGRNNGVILFEIQDSICKKPIIFIGDLLGIWREDVWAPISLKIHNYRCCSGYVDFIETYNPHYDFRKEILYELSSKLGFAHGTVMPSDFYKPVPVKVISDSCTLTLQPINSVQEYNYHLKKEPVVDNFPYKEVYFKFDGNVVAHPKQGAIGSILAEYISNDGESWCFVMMQSAKSTEMSVFCTIGDNNHLPYKVMGWIKKKHLNTAKE